MTPSDRALAGEWQAAIQAGPSTLHLALHFQAVPGGGWTGTLDSPDQHALGLPLAAILQDGAKVSFTLPVAAARFEGVLDPDGGKLEGTWFQGVSLPVTFTRGGSAQPLALPAPAPRPQEPQAPFPYDQEEITFKGGAKDVHLAATFTHPKGKGPFPAVVLIHGSGPNDRNETVFGHQPFLVLADHLTRKGIAVLRYDKRGIGASTGSQATATTFDFAADAEGALALLRGRSDVDPKKIGLVGHSEGGLIAPIVAAHDSSAAFLVLLAGPAVPGEAIILAQAELIAKAGGAPPEAIEAQRMSQERLFAIVKAHPDGAARQLQAAMAEEHPGQDAATQAGIAAQVRSLDTPWFRTFLTMDPRPGLTHVKVPVLALYGEKDLQVPPAQNRQPMEKALRAAGNPRSEVRVLPGLNHLFQPAKTGAPSEYQGIPTTFAPEALDAITTWIQKL
jgi:hypothetical protein